MTQRSLQQCFMALCLAMALPALRAQQWIAPTPEELSMTSIPEVPGAPAVYLFKEETADDYLHLHTFYYRVKILTEGGKDMANVELPYYSSFEDGTGHASITLANIEGRTIHPDGTIIPFTGKPYEKLVEKMGGVKVNVKIFSLPSVEVGSIIEYRYKLKIPENFFRRPTWIVQTDVFTRKAHYMWRPTDQIIELADGSLVSGSVAWTPILPPGVTVKQTRLSISSEGDQGHMQLDLDVKDIPPVPDEEDMPPVKSVSYRVLFYFTKYKTADQFWAEEGKRWSKAWDKFIGPGSGVKAAANSLVSPTDTQEQKLRKLYAAVMALENTDFTRERTTKEERAEGLRDIKSADDVLNRKRGSGDQLAALLVGLARAAGMKAYLMGVADRSERVFLTSYLSLDQLDDDIAIVNVDGKEVFFDPGQRYCSYGHLAWKHALSAGLRQTDGGTDFSATPIPNSKDTSVSRLADLRVDDKGIATGTATVTYTGDAALEWRQEALRGDETSLHNGLRTRLERELPAGLEVELTRVENLTDPERPLKVLYVVKGPVGSSTGKRLLVPADVFEANAKPRFPAAKREVAVDIHYPSVVQDAVRYTLPAALAVETAPAAAKEAIPGVAGFETASKPGPGSITFFRNVVIGKAVFPVTEYPALHEFYGKLAAKDQETLVLTRGAAANAGGGQ